MIVFSYNKGSFTLFSMWMTLFKDFIYLYLDREEGRKGGREGEQYQRVLPLAHRLLGTWPATQACALIGNGTSDPLVPKLGLNPLIHTSQGSTWITFIG